MRDPGQAPPSSAVSEGAPADEGRLSVDTIVGAARSATGLHDLGDPAAVEALGVLVDAAEAEAELSRVGRRRVHGMLVGLVAQRLRMVDFAATSDVVAYETVTAPIIVTGLPRTGTALLADLLAQDPANRALLGWQAATVAPPPALADLATDPRLQAAIVHDDRRRAALSDLEAKHVTGATRPTECAALLATSFSSLSFETLLDVRSAR